MTIAIVSCLGILAALGFTVTGAHLAARVHAAEHRLTVFFMPATGERADPRETGPLNVLPVAPTPPRGTAVLQDRMVSDVRAEYDMTPHGKHHAGERKPVTEQVIDVAEAPGRPPWPRVTGSFPKLDGAAEAIERTAYIRRQMSGAMVTRDPEVLRQVLNGLRAPEYGEAPQLDVGEAQERLARGLMA
ncbi:MAG TPA: hypothetical protein VL738_27970 [Dactylosporangium sp.]|nr:hypothetical protein [Dactylosporangium sp.]